jgi:hypothetical protein
LAPGLGAGQERPEEDVDAGVDDERVAVLRRGFAHRAEPLRVLAVIAEGAAAGVIGVLEVAAGGPFP